LWEPEIGRGPFVQLLLRGGNILMAATSFGRGMQALRSGDADGATQNFLAASFNMFGAFRACFPAGTKLYTKDGLKVDKTKGDAAHFENELRSFPLQRSDPL
jgi:hypothetical protein